MLYRFDPVQTAKTSVIGAFNMPGVAERLKAEVFQASPRKVRADPGVHPQPEAYRGRVKPIGGRSRDDAGKRCAETRFFDPRRRHDIPTELAHIFKHLWSAAR